MSRDRKDYMREYQRQWMLDRRAEFINSRGGKCEICNSTDRLEVDHKNPDDKLYNPSALWSLAKDNPRRIAELAKCQILCYMHHKEKTKQDKMARRKHGRTMYNYGCRCEICFLAQQKHNAQRIKIK